MRLQCERVVTCMYKVALQLDIHRSVWAGFTNLPYSVLVLPFLFSWFLPSYIISDHRFKHTTSNNGSIYIIFQYCCNGSWNTFWELVTQLIDHTSRPFPSTARTHAPLRKGPCGSAPSPSRPTGRAHHSEFWNFWQFLN